MGGKGWVLGTSNSTSSLPSLTPLPSESVHAGRKQHKGVKPIMNRKTKYWQQKKHMEEVSESQFNICVHASMEAECNLQLLISAWAFTKNPSKYKKQSSDVSQRVVKEMGDVINMAAPQKH